MRGKGPARAEVQRRRCWQTGIPLSGAPSPIWSREQSPWGRMCALFPNPTSKPWEEVQADDLNEEGGGGGGGGRR